MAKTSKATLAAAVGGLSRPAKMPCASYGLPASQCKVGALLARVDGSTCSDCYALKGRYVMPNVAAAQSRRLAILSADVDAWRDAMISAIRAERNSHFRWHDSGDVQGPAHLRAIVDIARALPDIRFWLPTRETAVIRAYLAEHGAFPENLTVRVSAPMRDQNPDTMPRAFENTSGVHDARPAYGFQCPAPSQGGFCNDCRACWARDVRHVSYRRH